MTNGTPRLGARQAWYVVAVLTAANVCALVDRQILSLLVEPIERDLQIGDTAMSLLMGLSFSLFYSILGLPLGLLADRGSRRRLLSIGIAVWSTMTLLCGVARSYGQLLLFRMGVGVGEAALGPTAISMAGDAFPPERRALALSVYSLGTFFGAGLAYLIGATVTGLTATQPDVHVPVIGTMRSWQVVFFAVGAPGLLVALLALTMREPPRQQTTSAAPLAAVIAHWRAYASTLVTIAGAFAAWSAVNYGIAAWLATFFVRIHGWSAAQAGAWQGTLTMSVGVAGALTGGLLAEWWTRHGRADAPLLVGLAGGVGLLVTGVAYPLVPSATVAAWLLVPVNLFAAMPWGAASAAVANALPSSMRALGAAIYLLALNLASGIVGPTSVALLADYVFEGRTAVRPALATATGAGMVIALVLIAAARKPYVRTVAALRER
ncbi:MAG TPA: MFS transporter [Luteitalea sp.]|nr:MFS transporter [Luteitalea sp.]